METNQFWDKNIKTKVAETEVTPPSFVWDKIEEQLPEKKKIIFFPWRTVTKYAAAILLFLGAGSLWFWHQNTESSVLSSNPTWVQTSTDTPKEIFSNSGIKSKDKLIENTSVERINSIRNSVKIVKKSPHGYSVKNSETVICTKRVSVVMTPKIVYDCEKTELPISSLAKVEFQAIPIEIPTQEHLSAIVREQSSELDDDVVLVSNIPGVEKGIEKIKNTKRKINEFLAKVIRQEDNHLILDLGRIEIVRNLN